MTDKQYIIKDLVGFAAGDNVAEFQSAFNQIIDQRAVDAVDAARPEVAQTFVNAPEEEQEEGITDDDQVTA